MPVTRNLRVRGALEGVRPYLQSHGGNVELLGIEDGVVRLKLEGSCSGCPSSAMTLKLVLIYKELLEFSVAHKIADQIHAAQNIVGAVQTSAA